MKIKITRKTTCTLELEIRGLHFYPRTVNLIYYIITGGTPALSFSDHSFSQRYEDCKIPNYTQENYRNHNITLDTIGGEATIKHYLDENLSKFDIRTERFGKLPTDYLKSPRFKDEVEHVYFHAQLELRSHYIAPVTVTSASYGGILDNKISEYANDYWRELMAFFNPLFTAQKNWETLTVSEFETAVALLAKGC